MTSCKPSLRYVLYTAGVCTLSLVVFSGMRIPGHQVETDSQVVTANQLITVRAASSTPPSAGSQSDGRTAAMGAGQKGSSADLPDGPAVPVLGYGSWHVVPGGVEPGEAVGAYTFFVEVEDGVRLADGDADFGRFVEDVLADPRSWAGGGEVALRRIENGEPDLRIRLASQTTARKLCGFELPYDTSCRIGNEVYLSAARWVRGAKSFGGEMREYRQYMVNHEVGHFLGHGHEPCDAQGGPAPVMMQQTFSTHNDELADITAITPQQVAVPKDGKACKPNPWPYPEAGR